MQSPHLIKDSYLENGRNVLKLCSERRKTIIRGGLSPEKIQRYQTQRCKGAHLALTSRKVKGKTCARHEGPLEWLADAFTGGPGYGVLEFSCVLERMQRGSCF